MKISLFLEMTIPKPWDGSVERDHFHDVLAQIEFADQFGFHCAWITEHHFLEEFAHSGASNIVLAALARSTKNIRLGHGVVQTVPLINHPARVAESIATLDVISDGRIEFGTGEGSSVAELGGFQVDPGKKRAMWLEGTKVAIQCLSDTPFRGFEGEFVSMPPRNVVPKPVQKPHPPVWVACTRESTITLAGENGIGALSFSFLGPDNCAERIRMYESALERAVPLARTVNPKMLFTGGQLICAKTSEEAVRRAGHVVGFAGHAVQHYYVGEATHRPGRENLYQEYLDKQAANGAGAAQAAAVHKEGREEWERQAQASIDAHAQRLRSGGIGDVKHITDWLRQFEDAGVDELMFQLPAIDLELNLETIEAVGTKILPAIIERDAAHEAAKAKRLAPIIEQIEARRVEDESPYPSDYSFTGVPVAWDNQDETHDEIAATLRQIAEYQQEDASGR